MEAKDKPRTCSYTVVQINSQNDLMRLRTTRCLSCYFVYPTVIVVRESLQRKASFSDENTTPREMVGPGECRGFLDQRMFLLTFQ